MSARRRWLSALLRSLLLPSLLWSALTPSPALATPPQFAWQKTGSGPAVVLLHCLGCDHTVWDAEVARLRARFTVVTVDLPGHGAAPAPEAVDFDAIGAELARLIRIDGLAPAILIGHSMGGTLAAWTAAIDPEAVRALVIVDSDVGDASWKPAALDQLRATLTANPEKTLRDFYRPECRPAQLTKIVEMARRVPTATFFGYVDYRAHHSLLDRVGKLTMPVLLQGSKSLLARGKSDAQVAQASGLGAVKALQLDRFPKSLHWIYWEQPKDYAASIDRFLSSQPPQAQSPPQAPQPPPAPKP
jgi:pimeloyl-ACP methyl ester carboxylesterase